MSELSKNPVQYARDKPRNCTYCYFWTGQRKGCERGGLKNCFYLVPAENHSNDRCYGCPYGRDFPCIGWCTVDVRDYVFNRKTRKGNN